MSIKNIIYINDKKIHKLKLEKQINNIYKIDI